MVPAPVDARQRDFRELVLVAIHRCAAGSTFLHEALSREFERTDFPVRLRGAATRTASGIIRRRLTLDHLIGFFSDLPLRKIDPLLLDVLRLGVYEILFVQQAPVHASVDEAVKLTKRLVREEFSGFTNALLRNLIRSIEKKCATPPACPDVSGARRDRAVSTRELAVEPDRVVRFNRDVFCDRESDPVGYLGTAGGMPRWLVERWRRNFGTDAVFRIVEASNAQPPVSIRVNTLKTTAEDLAAELARADVRTAAGEVEHSLVVRSPVELTALDAFSAGRFYIQDTSAMIAPRMLVPRAGEKVLDLCAAPGGKTTHLAELSGDRAEVYALDLSLERLALVEENARRLGITSIRTAAGDARRIDEEMKASFDAVLADVPCSNTGVLRRRVEARHRLHPETIERLSEVQADILRTALTAARPGGRVVYSTCSIEPEEDDKVVGRVLAENPDWTLDAVSEMLPRTDGGDGGYVARLVCR